MVQLTANRLGRAFACACIRQISAQAALIEPQSVGLRVGLQAVQRRSDRTQVYGHVLEGSGSDAAGSIGRREVDDRIVVGRNTGAIVRGILSVAADGCLTAVEEWRADDIVSVFSPIHIRLVSFVSALLA